MNYTNLIKSKGVVAEDKFAPRNVQVNIISQLMRWDSEQNCSVPISDEELDQFSDGISLLVDMNIHGETWSKNWKGYVGLGHQGDKSGWIKLTQPSLDKLGIEDVFALDGHYFDMEFPRKGRRYKNKDGEWVSAEVPVFKAYHGEGNPDSLYGTTEQDRAAAEIDMSPAGDGLTRNQGLEDFIKMVVKMGEPAKAALESNEDVVAYISQFGTTVDEVIKSGGEVNASF